MSYETIWAPWRLDYIKDPDRTPEPQQDGCFLCRYRDDPASDRSNFVVCRGESAFVVLNRFPYNNGHLLVAPLAHKGTLDELSHEEMLECAVLMQRMTAVLQKALNAEGFNIGLNLGRVAGAGLPGHLHWHIVPRWSGDSNFMTVMGDTNVIPQSLAALDELLRSMLASE